MPAQRAWSAATHANRPLHPYWHPPREPSLAPLYATATMLGGSRRTTSLDHRNRTEGRLPRDASRLPRCGGSLVDECHPRARLAVCSEGRTLAASMRRHRPELFAVDRGLLARMLIAVLLTPLLVLGSVGAVIVLASAEVVIGVLIAVTVGLVAGATDERHRNAKARAIGAADAPQLHAIVERLCLLADLPKPQIVIEHEQQPNSWIVGFSRRTARLHITTRVLALLTPSELEAVIGHELAHVAHHDVAVMSAAGGPGAVLYDGARRIARSDRWLCMWSGLLGVGVGNLAERIACVIDDRFRQPRAGCSRAARSPPSADVSRCSLGRARGLLVSAPPCSRRDRWRLPNRDR